MQVCIPGFKSQTKAVFTTYFFCPKKLESIKNNIKKSKHASSLKYDIWPSSPQAGQISHASNIFRKSRIWLAYDLLQNFWNCTFCLVMGGVSTIKPYKCFYLANKVVVYLFSFLTLSLCYNMLKVKLFMVSKPYFACHQTY